MVKEAKHKLTEREVKSVIVLGNPSWQPSLLGLVASSLSEEYGRPVFVWGRGEADYIKGSCRAPEGTNVVSIMEHVREVFIDAGGHAQSGGFSISYERIHELEDELLYAYERMPEGGSLPNGPRIDLELHLSDVNQHTLRAISAFAPFGEGNPKPTFLFRGAHVVQARMFGKTKTHLELSLLDETVTSPVRAVRFFADGAYRDQGAQVDILASIERGFGGGVTLRLID
jgi:single-stranded-DNA-specific exonuclease